MRIVTRPDFDGVVCAAIILGTETITEPVEWVEPGEMQHGRVEIRKGDIIANLPHDRRCDLWFDHHFTNRVADDFAGAFELAPSAAGVVYRYYREKGLSHARYEELIRETDKIDAAALSMDEVRHPEKYPYVLLSMTVSNRGASDAAYWNLLVELLREHPIESVMADPLVAERCRIVCAENEAYEEILLKHTSMERHVSVTDLRGFDKAPNGNRFLSYSLFPDAYVNVKIRYDDDDREKIILSVGHSIFNRKCRVNVGRMLSGFGGGGHPGAGSCSFPVEKAGTYIPEIVRILLENREEA